MIVLDTDVLSEPLKSDAEEAVLSWMAAQDDIATTAVTVAELLTGARRLSPGHRRDDLLVGIERLLGAFPSSVLPYDEAAAHRYVEMQESRRSVRHPVERRGRHDRRDLFLSVTRAGHQEYRGLRGARGTLH